MGSKIVDEFDTRVRSVNWATDMALSMLGDELALLENCEARAQDALEKCHREQSIGDPRIRAAFDGEEAHLETAVAAHEELEKCHRERHSIIERRPLLIEARRLQLQALQRPTPGAKSPMTRKWIERTLAVLLFVAGAAGLWFAYKIYSRPAELRVAVGPVGSDGRSRILAQAVPPPMLVPGLHNCVCHFACLAQWSFFFPRIAELFPTDSAIGIH